MRSTFIALAVFGLSAAFAGTAAASPSAKTPAKSAQAASDSPAKSRAAKKKSASSGKKPSAKTSRKKPTKQASRRPLPKKTTKPTKRAPAVPKAYTAMVHGWHERPEEAAPLTAEGRPMLVLECVNTKERIELRPERDDGGFSASELETAARFLADRRTGASFPTDPRLLDLAYAIARNFDAPLLRVVSGYRVPRPGSNSNHGHGRAIDIVVPGASDEEVAAFARDLGFVGVGTYPKSGFVHIDTRPKSYFWVDRSAPGRRNRTVGILQNLAAQADQRALARGETPPSPFSAPSHDCASVERAIAGQVADEDSEGDDDLSF